MMRRHYLEQLLRQRPEWLHGSMAEPTRYMTRTHVLLKRGEPGAISGRREGRD